MSTFVRGRKEGILLTRKVRRGGDSREGGAVLFYGEGKAKKKRRG